MRKLVKRKSVPRHGGKQGHLPPISQGEEDHAIQLASDLNLSSQGTINRADTYEKSSKTIDESEVASKKASKKKGSVMRQYAPSPIQTDLNESVL